MSDASVQKMINELPASILNMQVGQFLDGCETNDPEIKFWAQKPFELDQEKEQEKVE